jgi:hypothetical protein
MAFYPKDEPAHPAAEGPVTATLSRARKPRPENVIPPILTVGIGHRFYNPSLGRWVSRDPIGERGGTGLYALLANDPITAIDPFGHQSMKVPGFVPRAKLRELRCTYEGSPCLFNIFGGIDASLERGFEEEMLPVDDQHEKRNVGLGRTRIGALLQVVWTQTSKDPCSCCRDIVFIQERTPRNWGQALDLVDRWETPQLSSFQDYPTIDYGFLSPGRHQVDFVLHVHCLDFEIESRRVELAQLKWSVVIDYKLPAAMPAVGIGKGQVGAPDIAVEVTWP